MRKVFYLIFLFFVMVGSKAQTFNQDGSRKKYPKVKTDSILKENRYLIGAGIQYFKGRNRSEGHIISKLDYDYPQYNFFYRYQLVKHRKIHAFNFMFTPPVHFRSYETDASPSAFSTVETDITFWVLELGYTYFWRFGRKRNFCLGLSPNIGMSHYTGTRQEYGGSATSTPNGWVYNSYNDTYKVDEIHLEPSFNIELNQRFKFKNGSCFIVGVKSGLIIRSVFYLGFNFK